MPDRQAWQHHVALCAYDHVMWLFLFLPHRMHNLYDKDASQILGLKYSPFQVIIAGVVVAGTAASMQGWEHGPWIVQVRGSSFTSVWNGIICFLCDAEIPHEHAMRLDPFCVGSPIRLLYGCVCLWTQIFARAFTTLRGVCAWATYRAEGAVWQRACWTTAGPIVTQVHSAHRSGVEHTS